MRSVFKKLLAVAMAACMVFAMFPAVAMAASTSDGYQWTTNADGVTITGYTGTGGNITIPATISGKKVTEIGEYAFEEKDVITGVTIPTGVLRIDEGAFSSCSMLRNVSIPGSVARIGDWAFETCESLTSVTIPTGVKTIGQCAFVFCSGLTTVTLPNSLTGIEGFAFQDCTSLTSISIPSSVTTILDGAFSECDMLSAAFFKGNAPAKFVQDTEGVFSACAKGFTIYYPTGATGWTNPWHTYPTKAYDPAAVYKVNYNANGATSGTVPTDAKTYKTGELVTVLGNTGSLKKTGCVFGGWNTAANGSGTDYDAKDLLPMGSNDATLYALWIPEFSYVVQNGAVKITQYNGDGGAVKIPETIAGKPVTIIGDGAFEGNAAITSISIPRTVKQIGSAVFFGCARLTSITVDAANTAFTGKSGVLYDKALTALICCPAGLKGSFAVPGTVKKVWDYAFYGSLLTTISVPKSVTAIGLYAFSVCNSLTTISVASDNPSYLGKDGVLLNKAGTTLICCPAGKKGAYKIPGTVVTIYKSAFAGCTGLTGISIPASVVTVGDAAFVGCSGLTTMSIPSSVTSIGKYAVMACGNLTSVIIAGSHITIGDGAFAFNPKLAKVVFQGSKPTFGQFVFEENADGFKVYYPVKQQVSWALYTTYPKQAYCIVTIYPQNGAAATHVMAAVTKGHIAAPAAPTRTGYVFKGWYKESACKNAWNFTTAVITGDISVYAKWAAAQTAP